jgi:hypothetical protein
MKYTFGLRRFWWSWIKQDIKKIHYKLLYNIHMKGMNGTMIPSTGKGKFCSVYTKGQIIEIVDEKYEGLLHPKYDMIRIIPYQPNHGVMIECYINKKMICRNCLDINQLSKNIIFASNVEQLTGK